MTDARVPDRWLSDRRIQRLSDSHFRAFVNSLTWSATNRTDGVVELADLELIPSFKKDAVQAFIVAGLWEPRGAEGSEWLIVDFATTQTTAAQLRANEQNRVKEREKKARQRAAGRAERLQLHGDEGESTNSADAVVPWDVPGDNTGKARTGKDRQGGGESLKASASSENWPPWQGSGPDPFDEYK